MVVGVFCCSGTTEQSGYAVPLGRLQLSRRSRQGGTTCRAISLLLVFMPWRDASVDRLRLGLAVAAAIALYSRPGRVTGKAPHGSSAARERWFRPALWCRQFCDYGGKDGFLTDCRFSQGQGESLQTVGLGARPRFIGGPPGGQVVCGCWVPSRVALGVSEQQEAATAVLILAILVSPLRRGLRIAATACSGSTAPLRCVYGTVPE